MSGLTGVYFHPHSLVPLVTCLQDGECCLGTRFFKALKVPTMCLMMYVVAHLLMTSPSSFGKMSCAFRELLEPSGDLSLQLTIPGVFVCSVENVGYEANLEVRS